MNITGIMPCFNLISGQYPFVECLILALPLVDEFIINDGGSTDGTLEVLEELASLNKKIKIIKTNHKPGTKWDSIDEGIETCIRQASGDWIIEVQADEYYHPDDYNKVYESIISADALGCNGIRQTSISLHYFMCSPSPYRYRNIRIIRNLGEIIRSRDGGDSFHIEGGPYIREGFTSHNMDPEYDSELIMYNLSSCFYVDQLIRSERHYKFYAIGTKDREPLYEHAKVSLEVSENYDIESLPYRPLIRCLPELKDRIDPLIVPEIFHDLVYLDRYKVRPKLLDYICGL